MIVGSLDRMGAAASSMGTPTGEVGKITLTPSQQQQLDVVSNLFQLLLGSNNIVNLANLMSLQDDQCSDLIITLSAQLDKEFQRLRLASPKGEVAEVGFLSEAQYRKIQKSDVRVHMCEQIARFLLQFVILVAALTASVSIMDGLPDIQPREELLEPENLKSLPKVGDINPRLLSDMVDKQLLKEVRATGFPAKEVFEFYEDTFIHYKGYLYKRGNTSKIFSIQIDYLRSNTCPQGLATGQTSYIPSSTSTGTATGVSSSWLTPEEEQEEKIRQAKRQAVAEKTQQFEEEKYRAQRAVEEKTKVQEQLEIERYRLRSAQLLTDAKKKFEEIGILITEIDKLFGDNKIKSISASLTPSRPLPMTASDEQKKVYSAINNYNTLLQTYNSYERQIKTLEAEVNNEYIDRSATIKNAYEVLLNTHRNSFTNFKIQQELNTIQTTLSRIVGNTTTPTTPAIATATASTPTIPVTPTQFGGANEYFVFTISAMSNFNVRMPTQTSASLTGLASPAEFGQSSTGFSSERPFRTNTSGFGSSNSGVGRSGIPSGFGSTGTNFRSNRATIASNNYMSGGAFTIQFVMDYAGNTYELDYFCRMRGRVSKDQRSMTIRDRLKSIFSDETSLELTIVNKIEKNSQQKSLSAFTGFDFKKESIELLLDEFGRTISKSAYEIQSPAAQRAYLLLTQIKETVAGPSSTQQSIGIKACDDPWKNNNFSDIPAYALLGSLYSNVIKLDDTGDNINTTSLKGLPRTSDSTSDKLWGKSFNYDELYTNEDVRNFCSKGIPLTNKDAVGIVRNAYTQLKTLYGKQLEKVIEYMKQIFIVDRPFITALSAPSGAITSDSILRLNPRFAQNNAVIELLRLMQQARKDLDQHYSEVEKVYVKALEDLQKLRKPTTGGSISTRKQKHQHRHRQNSFRRKRVAKR